MSTIGNMMSYMLSTLVLAVFMFVLDWRLGLIAVIITLLASLVAKYMNKVSFQGGCRASKPKREFDGCGLVFC